MPLPAPLIAPLRAALQAQGFPANVLKDNGDINPAGILATVYDEVEFRASIMPTVSAKMSDLAREGGSRNPVLGWLRPTVVLHGKDGQDVIVAPYGASAGGSWLTLGLVAGGLVGAGFVLGRLTR